MSQGEQIHFQEKQLYIFILPQSGEGTLIFILPPFLVGTTLTGKNLLPFKDEPIREGLCHPGKLTGNHKSCYPSKEKGRKTCMYIHKPVIIVSFSEDTDWTLSMSINTEWMDCWRAFFTSVLTVF